MIVAGDRPQAPPAKPTRPTSHESLWGRSLTARALTARTLTARALTALALIAPTLVAGPSCTTAVPDQSAFACAAKGDVSCGVLGDVMDAGEQRETDAQRSSDAMTTTDIACTTTTECADNNPCTLEHCTAAGWCAHTLKRCDDSNPCTADICAGATGACHHAPLAGDCDDGDSCTAPDTCQDGACAPGAQRDCDDGNACSADTCQAGSCAHDPADAACSDGNTCTIDSCVAGVCVGTPGDEDGDGVGNALCGGEDCNDKAKSIHPGALEACNGLDDDCDGETDEALAWKGIALGLSCSVGVGACKASGTVLCAGEVATCNAKPSAKGSWSSSPAGNGSWDWNCDGTVSKRYAFTTSQLAKPSGWCKIKSDPSWTCHVTTRGSDGKCAAEFIANCGNGDGCGQQVLRAVCKYQGSSCVAAGTVALVKQECR